MKLQYVEHIHENRVIKIKISDVLQTRTVKKSKMVSVRIPFDVKEWMKKQKVSPTKVFKQAIKKIGGPWR